MPQRFQSLQRLAVADGWYSDPLVDADRVARADGCDPESVQILSTQSLSSPRFSADVSVHTPALVSSCEPSTQGEPGACTARCVGPRGPAEHEVDPYVDQNASYATRADSPAAAAAGELKLLTRVSLEQARTLISRNASPDIPFEMAANPYRGCEHGCVYCYARPTHAYLGESPGLDFETHLTAKINAVDTLRTELARPGHRVSALNLGSATDCYQPIEREWKLTRGLLTLLLETRHPVTIVTKSALIERDLDLLQALAQRQLVAVYISVTSLDAELSRRMEPRAAAPWRRLETVRRLSAAGIPTGVLCAPVVPFVNDEFLERILEQAHLAGAQYANYTVVRLPWEVRPIFEQWLQQHFPDRAERVLKRIEDLREGKRNDPRFGTRMRGTGIWADLLRQRYRATTRRLGLNTQRLVLDCGQFIAPARPGAAAASNAAAVRAGHAEGKRVGKLAPVPQMSLF